MIVKPAGSIVGVYILRHTASGSVYLGSSKRCVGNRLSWHLAALKKGYHGSPKLMELWSATNPEEWEFVVLERCAPDECRAREAHWCIQFEKHLGDHLATGFTHKEESKQKARESRARYLETPGARESLSERAVTQHQQRRLGASTWKTGPNYEKIADKWARTDENKRRLQEHIAEQTSEEMSRRSRCRKMFS